MTLTRISASARSQIGRVQFHPSFSSHLHHPRIHMASSVFYKWASRKDESRVTFDGTGITVFDLKREIILAHNLQKGNDFDVHVYDAATKQGSWTRTLSGHALIFVQNSKRTAKSSLAHHQSSSSVSQSFAQPRVGYQSTLRTLLALFPCQTPSFAVHQHGIKAL